MIGDVALVVASEIAKSLITQLGSAAAEGLLNGVVDLVGESVAKNHIDQYAAARLTADAAEVAKFGNEP